MGNTVANISINLENQDVVAFYREGKIANVQILSVRNGKIIGDKSYKLSKLDGIDDEELISSFIKQYYVDEPLIPEEIILSMDVLERDVIARWLSAKKNGKVIVHVPEKGRKKNLVKMAEENARFVFQKEESSQIALEELKEVLSLRNIPERIEAFDISNISGYEAVGASVLFVQGEPLRKGYRHFKIRDIEGVDDYSMISQVILRHYSRIVDEKKELPQLVVIDGGKGHLNVAAKVLKDLNLMETIDLIAVAKGKERNNLESDEIYSLKHKDPVSFPVDSPIKFLLQRISDEAHRFAIDFHRKLRKKSGFHSILDDVSGIGEKRKKQLLKHFGGMVKMEEASIDDLKKVPFVTEKMAEEIKKRL